MKRNAKKLSRALFVATLARCKPRCVPEFRSRGTKPGQANSHVFSFHNSGAKEAGVFRSGEARDVADEERGPVGEHGNWRAPQAGDLRVRKGDRGQHSLESDAIKAGYQPAK
jgi:hypothetical protein